MLREAARAFESGIPSHLLSADEFVDFEDGADARYELVGGLVYAQAGVSTRHSEIEANLIVAFRSAGRVGGCRVFTSGVRLRISDDTVYHPDVSIVCAEDGVTDRFITSPRDIVEILSPSTEIVDRREKLQAYRAIPNLLAYLLVHQDQPRVERYWREDATAAWQHMTYAGGGVPIPCLDITVEFASIYEGGP